ncbi:MAG: hypothetical protein ABI859_07980 [Pseudomonadota bacterium]
MGTLKKALRRGMNIQSTTHCEEACNSAGSAEALNRSCRCISLDLDALRVQLDAALGELGLSQPMLDARPHLFASLPVFIPHQHLDQMARVVDAVEHVVEMPAYRRAVMAWAPESALFDPGVRGGLLGFDFHLGASGPRLIEINTNPGGALLNAMLARVHHACCVGAAGLAVAPMEPAAAERALVEIFAEEWRLQKGSEALRCIAIVDDTPPQQYLYPEFLLFQRLLNRQGIETIICDPRELTLRDGLLWHHERRLDFVYNRLTDFSLDQPGSAALRSAYLAGNVVVSPNPRAHALYADKRNLTLLCDADFLHASGASPEDVTTLLAAVPLTRQITPENRAGMWSDRRHLFFKPTSGFGSKAAYRGDKITKRVWDEITTRSYVAQQLVAPSERVNPTELGVLKVDVRNYAYAGAVKLVAARLYQGQTTNFRTLGGGFAPVLTTERG